MRLSSWRTWEAEISDRNGGASATFEEFIFGSEDQDPTRFLSRLGGLLYLSGGAVLALTIWLPQFDGSDRPVLVAVATAATLIGLLIPRMPWDRWSVRAYLIPVTLSFVLIGVGSNAIPGVLNPYHVIYVMAFLFIGLSQPPGTAIAMVPVAALTLLVPELDQDPQQAVVTALISAPVWLIIGEVMAQSTMRLKQTERGTARLLEVSTALARATSETHAAGTAARFSAELLAADWALVLGNAESDDLGLVTMGRYESTAPLGHRWEVDEIGGDAPGQMVPLPGRAPDGLAAHVSEHHPATATLLKTPLSTGGHSFGWIIVGWTGKGGKLQRFQKRSLRLLAIETARALERLQETKLLERHAETDPLTGLFNRRSYNRALARLQPGDAVILADLDHFKSVNDRYGHATGDEILVAFSDALRTIARRSDSVARYGGEEFAWILPEAGAEGARHALERLQKLWQSSDPVATFSAGIAVHTEQDVPTTTLARADHALYQAKNRGRNRYEMAPAPTQSL